MTKEVKVHWVGGSFLALKRLIHLIVTIILLEDRSRGGKRVGWKTGIRVGGGQRDGIRLWPWKNIGIGVRIGVGKAGEWL
jgi:hypothetical protein